MKPRYTVERWPATKHRIQYFAIRDTQTRLVQALRTELAVAVSDAERMNADTSSPEGVQALTTS